MTIKRSMLPLVTLTMTLSLGAAGCSEDTSSNAQGSAGAATANTGGATASSGGATNLGAGASPAGTPSASGGATQVPASGGAPTGAGGFVATGGTSGGAGATATNGPGGTSGAGGTSASGGASGATSPDGGGAASCDRACLLGVMQKYLDALAARAPDKVPAAPTLKYTDNGATAQLGDGLWKTASQLVAGERMDFADTLTGQVGSQLVLDENGTSPVIYQVRLKVVSGQITEIESMTVRQAGAANGFFTPMNMKPQPVFLQIIDPAKRLNRDQLKAEVAHYIDYLDGKTGASGVHFDTMCARFENGVETANGLSSFQLQSWMFNVTARYLIFDEEMGLVWGMFPFT